MLESLPMTKEVVLKLWTEVEMDVKSVGGVLEATILREDVSAREESRMREDDIWWGLYAHVNEVIGNSLREGENRASYSSMYLVIS